MARGLRIGYPDPGARFLVLDSGSYALNGQNVTLSSSGGGDSLVHGQELRIDASGLGTRPDYNDDNYTWNGIRHIHYRFTDFAGGEPGTNTQAAWQIATNGFYPSDVTNYVARGIRIVDGGPSQSGKYHSRAYGSVGDGNDRDGGMSTYMDGLPNPLTSAFVCFKFRKQGDATGPGGGDTQGKFWRMYADTGTSILGPDLITREGFSPGNQQYWESPISDAYLANWRRWEIDMATSGTKVRTDGTTLSGTHSSTGTIDTFFFLRSDLNNQYNGHTMDFPNMIDADVTSSPHRYDFTDIYVDWSRARVEVTGPNGKTEIQPVSLWEDTGVNIIGNRGEMTSGTGEVNIYANDGSVLYTAPIEIE